MATSIAARWVSFDPVSQSITTFFNEWKPSSTVAPGIEWLCVSRLRACKSKNHGLPALMCAWETLCAAKRDDVTCLDVQTLAKEHNVMGGKRLIFLPAKAVDEVWWNIANAVVAGGLGSDAKVSTLHHNILDKSEVDKKGKKSLGGKKTTSKALGPKICKLKKDGKVKKEYPPPPVNSHVICVYASNFDDIDEVFKVREKLATLGFKDRLSFKPDAYSFYGIYSGNKWGIPPTMYSG